MKTVLEMSSDELKKRLTELDEEMQQICNVLDTRGQFVASHQIDDAIYCVRKALGVWNPAICWQDESLSDGGKG